MSKLNYDEEKAKVEKFFKRPLSDREFAEALLGKISYMQDEYACRVEDMEDAVQRILDEIHDIKLMREQI